MKNDGELELLHCFQSGKKFDCLQPFLHVFDTHVACSSEHGIHMWSLITFNLVHELQRSLCVDCELNMLIENMGSRRSANCRTILLYCSASFMLQFYVHRNVFELLGTDPSSKLAISWKFPSNEKWPWSHRKPGMACCLTDMAEGLRSHSKISIFVGTLGKKIYNMYFDFSDVDGFYDNMLLHTPYKQD